MNDTTDKPDKAAKTYSQGMSPAACSLLAKAIRWAGEKHKQPHYRKIAAEMEKHSRVKDRR